ncbi:hypothetical protein [Tropicibacter alexandrii]|jgi:hypothetical protein|uniref:hypothetical protein n=1 Tax=Tropicibacter alexandrii TaxID=2267683 RepID=UPI000EF53E51|nr:hypothetical protein [Tropicibacter alexandrii]
MSRRDGRKYIELRLPEPLRRQLEATTREKVPLAYLVRQALRRAMDLGLDWDTPFDARDGTLISLQLSTEERARLERWTKAHDVSEEVAVLSLVSASV